MKFYRIILIPNSFMQVKHEHLVKKNQEIQAAQMKLEKKLKQDK